MLSWAETLFKRRSEEFATGPPIYRCMPDIGPLQSFGIFKILQTPGTMGILTEGGTFRNVLSDGRELPKDPNPTWAGYSVGRWDGDAFVIASAGFNDQTWLDYNGHPHTEALHVTERFRRKNLGEMEVQITFDDPKAYARPWTIALSAQLMPDTEFVVELVGNELTMPPADGREALVPESPTVFYVTGPRLEFFPDASGRPTHFVLTIVEGDMKAVRKN